MPHIRRTKKRLGLPDSQKALCIFDVFRAQMGEDFINDLKKKIISIVFVPPSCTDRLQPMDLTVQKIVKDKLKERFQKSYANQISKQLENGNTDQTLTPVDLRLSFLKPLSAEWLVQVHADIKSDKILIYKGFEKSGIAEAVGYKFSSCEQ